MEKCHNTLKKTWNDYFRVRHRQFFVSLRWWFDAIKHSTFSNAVKKRQSKFNIQNHCFKNTRLRTKKYILFRTKKNAQTYNELKCVENVQWQIQVHHYTLIHNKSKMNHIWIFMSVYNCFYIYAGQNLYWMLCKLFFKICYNHDSLIFVAFLFR